MLLLFTEINVIDFLSNVIHANNIAKCCFVNIKIFSLAYDFLITHLVTLLSQSTQHFVSITCDLMPRNTLKFI